MMFSWTWAVVVVAFSWQMDLGQCAALVGFNHPWKGSSVAVTPHWIRITGCVSLFECDTNEHRRAGLSPFPCALYRDFPIHRATE